MADLLEQPWNWYPDLWDVGNAAYRATTSFAEMEYLVPVVPGDTFRGDFSPLGMPPSSLIVYLDDTPVYTVVNSGGAPSNLNYTFVSSGLVRVEVIQTTETTFDIWPMNDPVWPVAGGSSSSLNPADGFFVYELDKGWTFDGLYIPHFVVFNWYFSDNPVVYKSMQKVRVHGLAKGVAKLQLQTNGIQTDYREDFSQPELLNFATAEEYIEDEFLPATNYADLSNRGLAIQLKVEGSNTDLQAPEPAHVLQVLIPQTSPEGSGFSSN